VPEVQLCPLCRGEGTLIYVGQPGQYCQHFGNWLPSEQVNICPDCRGTGVLTQDDAPHNHASLAVASHRLIAAAQPHPSHSHLEDAMPDWSTLLEALKIPFDASDIQWRAGATSRDKTRAQALPYAEPRVYEDRLNQVCPDAWSVTFKPWGETRVICELTIYGVTRSSSGEASDDSFSPGTSAEAQAFKRACSKFGLGRYLYDLPAPWVAYDSNTRQLKEIPALRARTKPPATETLVTGTLLTKPRAAALHRELGRLPYIASNEHTDLASQVAKRPINSFTQLTELDARRLLPYAKKLNRERAEDTRSLVVSDAEAAAILGQGDVA
jgi:hypothetical protein